MKLTNHPCRTLAQPLTQTVQEGRRSASPGGGPVLPVRRVRADRQSVGPYLIDESNGDG